MAEKSDSTPRVLLCDENKGFGGAERHVITLARELHQASLLAGLAVRKKSWLAQNCEELPLYPVGYRNEVDMLSVYSLYRKLKTDNINVIHCIGHRDLVAAALARQLPGAPACALLKAEHSYPDSNLSPLFRWAYGQTTAITSVSQDLERALKETIKPVGTVHLEVIPNGVELHTPARREAPEGPLHIGVLSPLRPGKGHADFLRAAAALPHHREIRWSLAGFGEELESLKELAGEVGLEVEFLGHLENPDEYIAQLHLSVIPSHKETFSLVTLESLMLGCPVLAANSGGVEELCRNHAGAVLYPVGDVAELTRELARFIESPEKLQENALKAVGKTRTNFSSSAMAGRYQKLYGNLLDNL